MKLPVSKQTAECVLVDLSDQSARYLVVRGGGNGVQIIAHGLLVERADTSDLTLAQRLREDLRDKSVSCNRAALLLSRPTI